VLVHPIIKRKQIQNDIDIARCQIGEAEPNGDRLAPREGMLRRLCIELELTGTAWMIFSCNKRKGAQQQTEEQYDSGFRADSHALD
jgi:hypothetical protein